MSAPQSSAGRFAWTADESRRRFLRHACAVPLIAATMARRAAAGEATAQASAAAAASRRRRGRSPPPNGASVSRRFSG